MVTRNRVGLILLLCAVLVVTLLSQHSLQGAPMVQAAPCFSQAKQGMVFELLGYEAQADGSTIVRYRITNPGPRALDAVGFTASGWTPVTPRDRADYTGALGSYQVRWALHNLIPSHEAGALGARFQPQGNWFKSGAQETFVLTVGNFDPQRQLFAWVRANLRLIQVHVKPGDHNCLLAPPTPSPTPTLTATATPFVSPLPTIAPDPALTVDDYVFGKPRILLTNTAELVVTGWLPDNDRAIIVAASAPGHNRKQLIQTFDTRDNSLHTYGDTGFMYPKIAWLSEPDRIAFLKTEPGTTAFYLSDGLHEPVKIATGLFGSGFAGRGNQVMLLTVGASTPSLFNADGQPLSLPPINLFDYGINQTPGPFGPNIRWHPFEDKVMIFDVGGFIVWDLQTNRVQPYKLALEKPMWALSAEWSPDGKKIALATVEDDPTHSKMELGIMDAASGAIQPIPVSLSLITDLAWAPNSRQLIVAGHQRIARATTLPDLFLSDAETAEVNKIELASSPFTPSYRDSGLTWSGDGAKLLYSCRPPGSQGTKGLCELNVDVEGIR